MMLFIYLCFFVDSDLTGSQDGSVQLWEWGHAQPVAVPRPPGTYAKVTRVRFSQHGNKFGVADSDGHLSLWQVGLTANATRPFFVSCFDYLLIIFINFSPTFRCISVTAKE